MSQAAIAAGSSGLALEAASASTGGMAPIQEKSRRLFYSLALRGISLACRNSRTSRFGALIRSRSSVVMPARLPWSRSPWRTQFDSVRAVQPILAAIDTIAAMTTCAHRGA